MDKHTHIHTQVRQGIQTQTSVPFLGLNHEAKVYSLTPVALQTNTHHSHVNPLTSRDDTEQGCEEGRRGLGRVRWGMVLRKKKWV